jgi:hypothetical protein
MGRIIAFGTVVVGALVVADLWAHYRVTSQVVKAGVTESRLIAGK